MSLIGVNLVSKYHPSKTVWSNYLIKKCLTLIVVKNNIINEKKMVTSLSNESVKIVNFFAKYFFKKIYLYRYIIYVPFKNTYVYIFFIWNVEIK